MSTLERDEKEKRAVIEQIRKKAKSYTPEWRFDESNPDIGTALALVYADMFSGTVKRMGRMALKNEIAFFNCLGASLLPAVPARGYVRFGLSSQEWGGAEVPMGTVVSADAEDGMIRYETVDDLYVTPAKAIALYQTCDQTDSIVCSMDQEQGQESGELPLFHFQSGNLQRHVLYFSHDTAFYILHEAEVRLEFLGPQGRRTDEELLEAMINPAQGSFEYSSEEGFVPFERCFVRDHKIVCQKGQGQPAFEKTQIEGVESFWIRFTAYDIALLKKLTLGTLFLETRGGEIEPDTVYGNGVECSLNQYFPFGESLFPYSEVYFGSQEVLGKTGARIQLSFGIDFVKIPLEGQKDMVEWDWVMKRSDFKLNLEYDITIDTVIWEYFNGSGWARLFADNACQDAFSVTNGTMGQYKTIAFTCPQDMAPILINAKETCYIRARILKVNNLYKTLGNYIVPLLSNTVLSYQYEAKRIYPQELVTDNNLEQILYGRGDGFRHPLRPFYQTGFDKPALYLGFLVPPAGGPVKFLTPVKNPEDRGEGVLNWEYFTGRKWIPVNLADETEGFSKTGLITMSFTEGFSRKKLFGRELYWMRICDTNGYYLGEKGASAPILEGIFENTAKIVNVDHRETEYFTMMIYQENTKFYLRYSNLWEVEVFVDEGSILSEREMDQLNQLNQAEIVRDEAGFVSHAWVRWTQTEDFMNSQSGDRHFICDTTEGSILFGNGKRGMIPPVSRENNIRVSYASGGGKKGNVSSGQVDKLSRSIGFINQVFNPEPLLGGNDRETLPEALLRSAKTVRTQKKAVTLKDFEDLAGFASRSIQLAKCFSCLDGRGEPSLGAVTLVVLPKDFGRGQTRFSRIQQDIYQYMSDKISGNLLSEGKFFIIEPQYVLIRVRVEAAVENFNMIFKVKHAILESLEHFFYPEESFRQWKIGEIPDNVQIRNTVGSVKGLSYINQIFVSTYIRQQGQWVETEEIPAKCYAYPVGGEHEVIIAVE